MATVFASLGITSWYVAASRGPASSSAGEQGCSSNLRTCTEPGVAAASVLVPAACSVLLLLAGQPAVSVLLPRPTEP